MKRSLSAQKIWYISSALLLLVSAVLISTVFLMNGAKSREIVFRSGVLFVEGALNAELTKIADDLYLGLETLKISEKEINKKLGGLGKVSLNFDPLSVGGSSDLPQRKFDFSQSLSDPVEKSASRVTLFFGDIPLGNLNARIDWNRSIMRVSFQEIMLSILPFLGLLFIAWSIVFYFINKRIIIPMSSQNEMLVSTSAIARTTQALAHDVRKPFSMFKMIIDAVECQDDPIEAKQLLKEFLPEVQQAMTSVNGMISDVLEIGSESAPITEPTNPETLIEASLNEIFRVYPESKVNIAYGLSHKHKVDVDTLKIGRVFSNVVGNALQAMNQKGELWFKTEELEEGGKLLVKFCLGNGGSFIPPENLSRLFDAFFTSEKKGGTGLGLAIAQKIVTAHGGKIWCESDAQRGVEFFFTLPCGKELCDSHPTPLPSSSAVITSTFESLRKAASGGERVSADPLEVTLEKEIIRLAKVAKSPLKILVVDDENVYRNSLAALINRSEELKTNVALSFGKNSRDTLEGAALSPALIIQDVDLGVNSQNGYEVLKVLRAEGYLGVVCIHSNRTSPYDYKVALDAGADAVLPKPMSRTHFLKLMVQASERINNQSIPVS